VRRSRRSRGRRHAGSLHAPIGRAASDFDSADLHALGLDADAVALMKPGDQGVGGLDVWFEEVDAE
jgi:hypothetical protein